MDLNYITQMYVPIVMAACLVIGYCVKHITCLDRISNQYIPSILAIAGAVLTCIDSGGVTLNSIVAGAVTGLASTGLYEAFRNLIGENEKL
ncbi:holin [Clostridium sp. MCC353]|uniref:phage holin family protein n=1 Tax=Clostridium sp. MCC353 TaxID=2592646 RepID=UPI001C00BB08|nr:phage holin family protein [Clostridium sp. MCC353]MBT9778854.1 holin [Clostridium sp. MCC353]